jgi:hypothetical protein
MLSTEGFHKIFDMVPSPFYPVQKKKRLNATTMDFSNQALILGQLKTAQLRYLSLGMYFD